MKYRVIRDGAFARIPIGAVIELGAPLPVGDLSDTAVTHLLTRGLIEPVDGSSEPSRGGRKRPWGAADPEDTTE